MKIKVGIERLHKETYVAIGLIEKLLTINNINRNIKVAYDFQAEELGYYYSIMQQDTIFINPDKCISLERYNEDDHSLSNTHFIGYAADSTTFGVVLHEFSHYICFQLFKHLTDEYKKEFPNKRLYLQTYSNVDLDEEIANNITLYISNPYLLKLISEHHYYFFNRFFKSPVTCTKFRCYQIYKEFPIHVKNELKTKWGIVYNISTKEFERVEVINTIKENNEV